MCQSTTSMSVSKLSTQRFVQRKYFWLCCFFFQQSVLFIFLSNGSPSSNDLIHLTSKPFKCFYLFEKSFLQNLYHPDYSTRSRYRYIIPFFLTHWLAALMGLLFRVEMTIFRIKNNTLMKLLLDRVERSWKKKKTFLKLQTNSIVTGLCKNEAIFRESAEKPGWPSCPASSPPPAAK